MENQHISIKYSQNFLRGPGLVREIINKSSIGPTDVVYEIGPGKGIITDQLAKRCAKVIGVEKDRGLCQRLQGQFSGNDKVEVRCGDFLAHSLPGKGEYKVFSNIPFNLTAEIIAKLTTANNPPADTYLIVQEEAAKKFAGSPYGSERQYSLLLKPWFELKILHHFRQDDFYPIPRVKIVLLQIRRREQPLVKEEHVQPYRDFVVYGFNQWKDTFKKALGKIFTHEQFKRLARNLKFDLSAVPTDLNFEQWLGLFEYFLIGVEESKRTLVYGSYKTLKRQQSRLQKIHRTRNN